MQAMHACRRFFRSAKNVRQKLTALRVQDVYEIAAVVNDDIGLEVECLVDVFFIFLVTATVCGEDMESILDKRCCDIILRGQRIAARDGDFRSSIFHDKSQICRLCFKVKRDDDLLSSKRLRHREFLVDGLHDRHEILNPVDLFMSGRCKLDVFDH